LWEHICCWRLTVLLHKSAWTTSHCLHGICIAIRCSFWWYQMNKSALLQPVDHSTHTEHRVLKTWIRQNVIHGFWEQGQSFGYFKNSHRIITTILNKVNFCQEYKMFSLTSPCVFKIEIHAEIIPCALMINAQWSQLFKIHVHSR
jgi:hypothetical protein